MKELHYTDTIQYELEQTARLMRKLALQLFDNLKMELSVDECVALDTVSCNPNICQRDLSKLILKDRANTGKLLDSLEAKGLVERELAVKNNRPVKIVKITEEGKKVYNETYAKLTPHHKIVEEKIANTDLEKVGELLKDLREILEDTIDIGI